MANFLIVAELNDSSRDVTWLSLRCLWRWWL
jgi:hypothetical protein